ncbi:alpha/beta hydrolase-fold protein [Pelagibacteraceae bacterium]|nr:alpha/beta hydrolase-fold protein [Pelagibacteraceae bacterium]
MFFGIFLALLVYNYYASVEVFRDPPSQGKYETYFFNEKKYKRSYSVYIPKSLKKNSTVIFVLHGSKGTSESARKKTGYDFEYLAEEKGLLIVYPQGFKNHWNGCRASADYETNILNINDIEYFKKVIKSIQNDFNIDKTKLIVTGMSNGGHMVYKLAHEIPEEFFLYSAFAANLPIDENNDCFISNKEVNMIIFNGSNDQINPHEGGLVSLFGNDSRGLVISSDETYEYWRSLTSPQDEKIAIFPELDGDHDTTVVMKESSGSKIVALYTLKNGGHIYASPNLRNPRFLGKSVGDINTAEEIYSVYKRLSAD